MKLTPILLLSTAVLLLISACVSEPKLKPYVPKENVKVIYVTKEVNPPTENTGQDYLEPKTPSVSVSKVIAEPSLIISDIRLNPDPVPVNQSFDFHVKFKADSPGSSANKITALFYFKIIQSNKTLFTSKHYPIKVNNGKMNTRTQHMNPVPAKGIYTIKAFVTYKNLLAEKSIELVIQ